MALIQLGKYQFDISGAAYSELERVSQALWVENTTLGGEGNLQVVGRMNDRIELRGIVFSELAERFGGVAGTGAIDDIRGLLEEKKPLRIVGSDGTTKGFWVVEQLRNIEDNYRKDGVPKKQRFVVNLRYYGAKYPL